jgi:hypothetical protein
VRRSPDPRVRRRLALFSALAMLVLLTTALSLLLVRSIDAERARLAEATRVRATCRRPPEAPEPPSVAPPGAPPSEPRGADAYIARGTDILPVMRLRLERVRPQAEGVDTVRFGDHEVLPADAVHVVSLWAPWCAPCKHLLPRLREMFVRRGGGWGTSVGFLPVQVRDATSPAQAYAAFGALMPGGRARLADRSQREDFVELLRAPGRGLYTGSLPLTLVLDCNRRVRWVKEGALSPVDERDLERRIDEFVEELRSDDPRCKQRWCGNGRCEPGEQDRCDDCEPARVVPPPVVCPRDCLKCDPRGSCLVRAAAGPARCGNGRCEPGESPTRCCRDCPCKSPFSCRKNADRRHVCLPPPLLP